MSEPKRKRAKKPAKKVRKKQRPKAPGLPTGKGNGGRTLWTAPRRKTIIEGVRKGHYRKTVALTVSVDERTIKRWVADGRQNLDQVHEGKVKINTYGQWVLDLDAAEAEAEIEALDIVINVARDSKADARVRVQAAQWYLERKHPKRYGIQRLEISGPDGGPLKIDARSALLDRLNAMAKRAEGAEG